MITMLFYSAVYGGLHHNVCNVGSHSAIVLDLFQTGITFIRWQKWFTETGQKITVTGQIHGSLCQYRTHACMHSLCDLKKKIENWSNKIKGSMTA